MDEDRRASGYLRAGRRRHSVPDPGDLLSLLLRRISAAALHRAREPPRRAANRSMTLCVSPLSRGRGAGGEGLWARGGHAGTAEDPVGALEYGPCPGPPSPSSSPSPVPF